MQSLQDLLDLLVCPETHQPLAQADDELVRRINEAVSAGTLVDRSGKKVSESIEGGLIRRDGDVLYPVRESIPVLLIDESIALDQPALAQEGEESGETE